MQVIWSWKQITENKEMGWGSSASTMQSLLQGQQEIYKIMIFWKRNKATKLDHYTGLDIVFKVDWKERYNRQRIQDWHRCFEINSMYWTAIDVFFFFSICHALKTWFERSRVKLYGNRVHTVLKSPWILGEVLEKSLNFCASPWKVLELSLTLNVVAWTEFWCFLVVQDRI